MFGFFCKKKHLRAMLALILACNAKLNAAVQTTAESAEEITRSNAQKNPAEKTKAVSSIDTRFSNARVLFLRREYREAYREAKASLKNPKLSNNAAKDAKWIIAESLFRLGELTKSKAEFNAILQSSKDPIERRKAAIRIFDIHLRSNDLQATIDYYVSFEKQFKKPTARMRYGLGKALYDGSYFDMAEKTLRLIPKGNEFYIRARYIMASIGLDKRRAQASVKLFRHIEEQPSVSVEDYSVHELSILAQGRILSDNGREDLAEKAYLRVSLAGEFGETATIELIRGMLSRAERASSGEGAFKKASKFRREQIRLLSIDSALKAIARFRKEHKVDSGSPEFMTVMGLLYVKAKRWDEARLAFDGLIEHYRLIEQKLLSSGEQHEVWPFFSLQDEKKKDVPLIEGVAPELVSNIKDVPEISRLRDRIKESEKKLKDLRAKSKFFNIPLAKLEQSQESIVTAYNQMVLKKQRKIAKSVVTNIKQSLTEAEFMRAELVVVEMKDLKKQLGVIQEYQSKEIDLFEKNLREIDEKGGSS